MFPAVTLTSNVCAALCTTFHLYIFIITLVLLCHHFEKLFSGDVRVYHMVRSGPLTHPERPHRVDSNLLTRRSHLLRRSVGSCQLGLAEAARRRPSLVHVGPPGHRCSSAVNSAGTGCNVLQTNVQHFRSN